MMKNILSLITLLLLSAQVIACSCDGIGISDNFKVSDAVFIGRVVEVKEIISKETITGSTYQVDYRRYEFIFRVSRKYKGLKGTRQITIITTGGETDCGNYFKKGKKYLVYAYKDNIKLSMSLYDQKTDEYMTTSLCTRTKRTSLLSFIESLVLSIL